MDRNIDEPNSNVIEYAMEIGSDVLIPKGLSGAEQPKKLEKPKDTPQPLLRQLQRSDRYFWKASQAEQLSQAIADKTSDGNERSLPGNEITVMALNEIAVQRGRGFFLHLKNRDGWKKKPSDDLCPASRVTPQPRAQFPALVYMNYVWSDASRANFFQSSHRSRYLACDALINPPAGNTPLYGIQYATHKSYAVYVTPSESLVVLSSSVFHLAFSSELEKVIGLWPKRKRPPSGPDPHLRLNTAPYIWEGTAAKRELELKDAMRQFEVQSVEALYDGIIARCKPDKMPSTFTARGLRQTIPRPLSPEPGVVLGTPLSPDMVIESSNPPSRRGGRLQRGPRAQSRGPRRYDIKDKDAPRKQDRDGFIEQ